MKTNKILNRAMGQFAVQQRTRDSMFNATELAKQWNALSEGGNKLVADFLRLDSTKQFISALEGENDNMGIPIFTKSRGKNGGTWMSSLLFIDFAMWLNPAFKVKVLKFVYDELIKNRHDAGDDYRVLSKAVSKLEGHDYGKVAKALNFIVFGKHEDDLRQNATQDELKELTLLQKQLTFSIEMGQVEDFESLMSLLRVIWNKRIDKYIK